MPLHRIPRAHLHADIRAIERDGERVISVAVDGDHLLVVTEFVTLTRGELNGVQL